MKIHHGARGILGIHTAFTMLVLSTNDDMVVDTWLLASSCKWSRQKRASAFFFHFEASPAPAPVSTAFPLKLTFFVLLAGWMEGPASFAEVSTILLALWAEVEGPVGRIGASGVGGTAAGDGLVLEGFWPLTFLLLCATSVTDQNKSSYRWYESKKRISSLLPLRQVDSGGVLRHGV
jgi:hypothetical protein